MHYNQAKRQIFVNIKTEEYTKLGYKIVRIPYFVQIETKTIKHLFDLDYEYKLEYPHGFIDSECLLPADFNYLGIQKFENDLLNFDYIKHFIIDSLYKKIEQLESMDLVVYKNIKKLL